MPTPTAGTAWEFSTLTGEAAVDAVIAGTQWASGTISFSFANAGSVWSTAVDGGYGPQSGGGDPWSPEYAFLTASDQAAARSALASWAAVADLHFVESADNATTVGTLRLAYTYTAEMEGAQAYAYLPGSGPISGDLWFNSRGSSATEEWIRGSHEYMTVIHELGHAIGLKHPFTGTPESPGTIDPRLDSRSFTIMSYSAEPGMQGSFYSFEPTTPMVLDIAAIQSMYGVNTTRNAGNTGYVYGDTANYHQTIWDAGGVDTITHNGATAAEIDLTEGIAGGSAVGKPLFVFDTNGVQLYQQYNLWIAYGTVIENANGGAGGDVLIGNGAANRLDGRGGNDTVDGGAGADTLVASAGADLLRGGTGADTLSFGNATLGIKANLALTGAQATNQGSVTLASIENLAGSAYPDLLTGSTSANRLTGGAGNDTLTGAAGNDVVGGGAGSDVFVLSSLGGSDTLTDFTSGIDDLRIRMSGIRVGDGDAQVEGALTRAAPGGFSSSAELAVFTANLASLTTSAAATAIGSATSAYSVGRTALFAVDNGSSSALYLFTAADANAVVSASELRLLATLTGTASTALGDYVFG